MGRLPDTCNTSECSYIQEGGKREGCPNFVQLWFTPLEGGQPYLTNDCAPKRTVFMIMDLVNSNIGLQKANEEMRNYAQKDLMALKYLVQTVMQVDIDNVIPIETMAVKAKKISGGE